MSKPHVTHAFKKQLKQIVEEAGAEFIDVLPTKKHAHITIRHNNILLKVFVASTPSDRRAWLNMKTHVRRVMRESDEARAGKV